MDAITDLTLHGPGPGAEARSVKMVRHPYEGTDYSLAYPSQIPSTRVQQHVALKGKGKLTRESRRHSSR